MTKYVCGFYYVTNPNTVLLIRKNRPIWQKGRLNGVGGHVNNDESPAEAMQREFEEEAGFKVIGWRPFLEIGRCGAGREGGCLDDFRVYFYYFKGSRDDMSKIQTKTDEVLEWHPMNMLPDDIVPNLAWIIPLSMEREVESPVMIRYK